MPSITLHPDLFGPPTPILSPEHQGRGNKRGYTGGYAAKPGTGPAGQICKRCYHYTLVEGHTKTYRKCGLMESQWTHGKGSDIKAGAPACRFFEETRNA
jgi:hypothetical protein